MFDEFLGALLCFSNLLIIVLTAVFWLWMRRQLHQMRERLVRLEGQPSVQGDEKLAAPATVVAPLYTEPLVARSALEEQLPTRLIPSAPPAKVPILPTPPALVKPTVSAPARPTFWEGNPLLEWFTRIHLMVQIGMIVLFFGVGFLVKYAVDQGWFPLTVRLASAALLGIGLAAVGWAVRKRARVYGLALIGGGIGIVYLTTFGAYSFYQLLSTPLAFGIFVLLGIAYAVMATLNDAWILAFLALVGAFLAPILASDGGGNHVVLFSYYAVVNAGILALAWFKSWRSLNLISFGFTLIAGVGWGLNVYDDPLLTSTQPFLLLFFFFYLTITIWSALQTQEHGLLDTLLLFANPLAAFALQAVLLEEDSQLLAQSALVVATIYAALSLLGSRGRRMADLAVEGFIFLATFFLALSIPLLFDPHVTPASWAVLGAGLIWLGARRRQMWPLFWGIVVHGAAGLAFLYAAIDAPAIVALLFTNYLYISTVILGLTALASGYMLERSRTVWPRLARLLSIGFLLLGLFWWFIGGFGEIFDAVTADYIISSLLAFVVLSSVATEVIGRWLAWSALRKTMLGLLPFAALVALQQWLDGDYFLIGGGWYAWPLVLAAHLFMLWRWTERRWSVIYHAGGVWLFTFVLTNLALWQIDQRLAGSTWSAITVLGIPTLILLLVGPLHKRMPWPITSRPFAYTAVAATPIAFFLSIAATVVSLTQAGDPAPLAYLPLLNPLDIAIVGMLTVLWLWWYQNRSHLAMRSLASVSGWILFGFTFLLVNAGVTRAVHHLTGVPLQFDALFVSATLQTILAIFWGSLALVLMFVAHRRGQSQSGWTSVWYAGATILGLTVAKLFLVDLAQTGTVARIISFMSVGLLILVIAYFWPAPPKKRVVEPEA